MVIVAATAVLLGVLTLAATPAKAPTDASIDNDVSGDLPLLPDLPDLDCSGTKGLVAMTRDYAADSPGENPHVSANRLADRLSLLCVPSDADTTSTPGSGSDSCHSK
ncbi:MAG: hypothetical protein GEV04_00365 [Actinophytocola sp.]|nr:hypothetical protein [Actinophytocola sp.]